MVTKNGNTVSINLDKKRSPFSQVITKARERRAW